MINYLCKASKLFFEIVAAGGIFLCLSVAAIYASEGNTKGCTESVLLAVAIALAFRLSRSIVFK